MKYKSIFLVFCLFGSFSAYSGEAETCAREAVNARAFDKVRALYMEKVFGSGGDDNSLMGLCFKGLEEHHDMELAMKCVDDDVAIKKEVCATLGPVLKKDQEMLKVSVKEPCSVVQKKITELANGEQSSVKRVAEMPKTPACEVIVQILSDNEVRNKKISAAENFCHPKQTKLKNCDKAKNRYLH